MIWIKIRADVLCVLSLVPSCLQRLSADSINLGGTLLFLYIRRLGSFFCSKFSISIFFGVSEKIFFGVLRFCGYFLGHHKIGLYVRFISMHFVVFS